MCRVHFTNTQPQQVKRDSTAQPADGSTGTQQQQLELLFECSGSERVDPSWVGRLYHPEVTAQKDNKVWGGSVERGAKAAQNG